MTRRMMLSACAAVAALLFGLPGNAVAQGAQTDPGSIKRIAIDPDVSQPEIPLIQSPSSLGAFGLVGGIGAAIDQQDAGKVFREYMRNNDIDISRIVFDSFKRVIEEDKTFEVDADAKLKLAINTYGFGVAGLFGGNDRRPLINVTVSLVSGNGNVVWKKTEFITNMSKLTEAYTYDQFAKDPGLVTKSFEQASTVVARQMLASVKPSPAKPSLL